MSDTSEPLSQFPVKALVVYNGTDGPYYQITSVSLKKGVVTYSLKAVCDSDGKPLKPAVPVKKVPEGSDFRIVLQSEVLTREEAGSKPWSKIRRRFFTSSDVVKTDDVEVPMRKTVDDTKMRPANE